MEQRVEVAIVGGGPAGAALAIRLAGAGRDVALLERAPSYRWRACGVFSPTALPHLAELGLGLGQGLGLDEAGIASVARPIPSLRLEVAGAPPVVLDYGARLDGGQVPAVGFDRAALDTALLQAASASGACVRTGTEVVAVTLGRGHADSELLVRNPEGREETLRADVLVGADGIRSVVARVAGVVRRPPLCGRFGITFHVAESEAASPLHERTARPARMIAFDGGYCGIAPVPGGRLNVGIVLHGKRWRAALRRDGVAVSTRRILDGIRRDDASRHEDPDPRGLDPRPLDRLVGAFPLAHSVERTSGSGWLLVGDAAGFLDPFTGEGLGRAFVSARLAAEAITERQRRGLTAFDAYTAEMRRQFEARDRLTRLIQFFVPRPGLLAYAARRIARRESLRRTIDMVLAENLPAERALEPRFLAALLAP